MEKKRRQEPKVNGEVRSKHVGIGKQRHTQLGPKIPMVHSVQL
jgi:hypothetical protein